MSINFIEGFDDGLVFDNWNFSGGVAADIDAAYGRHGKGARIGDSPGNYLQMTFATTTYQYASVGFACYVVDYGGTEQPILTFDSNYNLLLVDENNERIAYRGGGSVGTQWAANNSFTSGTWHYVEFNFYNHDSAGYYDLKVDGSTVLSDTGIDTRSNTDVVKQVTFGSHVDDVYFDDIWLQADTSALTLKGDIEVATLLPSGNGTSSDMLGSDSNSTDNYLLVDNNAAVPPATTEYVGSATEGDTDTYAMDDVSGTPTVLAVQATLYASMTDTGPKSIRPVIRSGSTDYPGATVPLQNSVYVPVTEMWETDPDTAVAWTYGGVNAMEVGQEVRDS